MVITYNQSEIDSVAQRLLALASSKILLFYGDMGAGKTTLIKAMIRALGAFDTGSSPTFSLVNEYNSPNGLIYHFDLYRIEDESEIFDIGIEEYLHSDAWIFIEWPQKIENFLTSETGKVKIEIRDENKRMLNFC